MFLCLLPVLFTGLLLFHSLRPLSPRIIFSTYYHTSNLKLESRLEENNDQTPLSAAVFSDPCSSLDVKHILYCLMTVLQV